MANDQDMPDYREFYEPEIPVPAVPDAAWLDLEFISPDLLEFPVGHNHANCEPLPASAEYFCTLPNGQNPL